MGYVKYLASGTMILLFTIAIISYVANFGNDNNAVIGISSDGQINNSGVRTDINTFKLNSNASSEAFSKSEVSAGDEISRTGGVWKGSIIGLFSGVKNVVKMGFNKIFGGEQGRSGFGIILTALTSFLTLVAIAYAWKAWKGNPD